VVETLREWQDEATTPQIWRDAIEGDDSLVESLRPHLPVSYFSGFQQTYTKPHYNRGTAAEAARAFTYAAEPPERIPGDRAPCPAYAVDQGCNTLSFACEPMPQSFAEHAPGRLRTYISSALVHIPLRLAMQQQKLRGGGEAVSLASVLGGEDPWGCAHLPDCDMCCSEGLTCCRPGYCCQEFAKVCSGDLPPAPTATTATTALAHQAQAQSAATGLTFHWHLV
jgi:hypothetical protein